MTKRIFLTGFMTCGKTTIGKILANALGWNYYDLDEVITQNQKQSVVKIFETKGEEYFRELERETLKELILQKEIVVSLGGGTIAKSQNIKLLKESGKIIFLETSAENIYHRLKYKLNRPLFNDLVLSNAPKEKFLERINEILKSREKFYTQADFTFNTDKNSVGITVDLINNKIKRLL